MQLGWAVMLTLTGAYYPQLVCEFYANITDKDTTYAVIHTSVKGKSIKVDPSLVSRLLKVTDEGNTLKFSKKGITNGNTYDEARTRELYGLSKLHTIYLNICEHLIIYLIGFNIVPDQVTAMSSER
ncbi:unnamed protein product [Cuscuta epithymum]|uniref:Putative plant transposon protein domain-containing protein n=1 Tax=Cuscuta epithymum TaxID=186058 RepID=A0AAV0DNL1_9ASTE|nr:unnamed protein product [Cuscuta epithymum]